MSLIQVHRWALVPFCVVFILASHSVLAQEAKQTGSNQNSGVKTPVDLSSAAPVVDLWPHRTWELGVFGGFGLSPYGSSISSKWDQETFQSPVVRIEGSRSRRVFNPQWSLVFSLDLNYLRSVQTQSSSQSSASLTTQVFMIGSSAGLRYDPPAMRGFGLRAGLGLLLPISGSKTTLETGGFATDVQSPHQGSLFGFRGQVSIGLHYQVSSVSRMVLEARTFENSRTVLGGFEHEI